MLGSAAIAFSVVNVLLAPEVASGTFEPGGDHVPAGPATTDQVQRSELAGAVKRFGLRGGKGG